ncbi:gliding motility lipoprotein GldH [Sphingobacterium bovistauri]|uniref:Gliding motility lipoprotein GldH n=1 Tax=Sphingobacterium bovistauri TaxID=2781959 RepID=A0ABS7Z5U8_9SPHI|nr:gliding motility lipoprotein GldH [Sphingobacterium bovistauri]MCA5005388.1 gliding motility lipoprotein GldH [Sphingobacterium bovistauri]
MNRFLAFIFLLFSLGSCMDNSSFEENKVIANRSWDYAQIPTFSVKIKDNKAKYDVLISVRHTNQYDFSNLFILLHEKGKGLLDTAYRKEIKLAELDGKWTGKSSGSLYETQYLAKENFTFPDTGTYTFSIEQNMRVNPLTEISDVGIKLLKK